MTPATRRASRGFSLLEVLVAFTILAMLLGALFQVFSGGMHAARAGDRHTRATVIAQSQLSAASVEYPPAEGFASGRTDDGFDWRVSIAPYSDDLLPLGDAPLQPYIINVEVFWEEGGSGHILSLESILLGPVSS